MLRTPSPQRRARTPPAPLHGAQFDSWVPFSPRRSGRVAAQRDDNSSHLAPAGSKVRPNQGSLQNLSPPSSPMSTPRKGPSTSSARRIHFDTANPKSETDDTAGRLLPETSAARGMLPTPAKTPRKRPLKTEESLRSTSRVLFHNRPSSIEDAMPTPRKNRKSTLDVGSLDDYLAEDKIEIYTDSHERIPTVDHSEDNPFITRKGKGKAKARAQTNAPSKARKVDPEAEKMRDAADRGEGMIYLFRGKKIFRKFDDEPSHESDQPELSDNVRKQAGCHAHRPLTRSSIKPRVLFQEEIKKQRAKNEEDEEAETDIETPIATPSRRGRKTTDFGSSSRQAETTPPPTVRVQRHISFEDWSRVKPTRSTTEAKGEDSTRGKKRARDGSLGAPHKRTRIG